MQFYSQLPARRAQQIIADVVALVGVTLSVVLGVAVGRLILTLAGFGRDIEGAGLDLQRTLGDAATTLGGIPLVGSRAEDTLSDASAVGRAIAEAGRDQQQLVATASTIIGIVIALVPIALIARYWLVRRIRFARHATEVRVLASSSGGTDLLALRALASVRPALLLAVSADPVGDWRRGAPDTIAALAALQLRDSGVRRP
ncbi:MAG: conserved rane protein [Glaciihabitans sp.]|nr:conserved rane protein [Glaciihabitans sp.]